MSCSQAAKVVDDLNHAKRKHDNRNQTEREQEAVTRSQAALSHVGCLGWVLHGAEYSRNRVEIERGNQTFTAGKQAREANDGKCKCHIAGPWNYQLLWCFVEILFLL